MGTGSSVTGAPPRVDRWLPARRPVPGAAVRLFCFPHSGTGASLFRGWQDVLPGVEVCAVQLPGRETRIAEPPCRCLDDLVPAVARALAPYLDRPYALLGHSLGALLAFEVARQLRRDALPPPVRLVVSAHRAPRCGGEPTAVHRLPDDAFAERLRAMGGTPDEVLRDPELRGLLFPILRADFEMSETYAYRPEAPLGCAMSALGGLEDGHVGRDSLEAWRLETSGPFQLRLFRGGHFFLHASRAALLEAIARDVLPPTR